MNATRLTLTLIAGVLVTSLGVLASRPAQTRALTPGEVASIRGGQTSDYCCGEIAACIPTDTTPCSSFTGNPQACSQSIFETKVAGKNNKNCSTPAYTAICQTGNTQVTCKKTNACEVAGDGTTCYQSTTITIMTKAPNSCGDTCA